MEITHTRDEGEMNYLNDPQKENKIERGSLSATDVNLNFLVSKTNLSLQLINSLAF